ncbi:MAG: OmpA family protein [Desulfuromonadales bacterium]|nr:OmpA family protein [Desulfuromonadales bacterium]
MRNFIIPAILILVLIVGGCVKRSTYEQKSSEAAQLLTDLTKLKALHTALLEKFTTLQDANAGLNADLARAGNDIKRLESVLSMRSAETGQAMAEMREEIDRLMLANRELEQQLDTEKIARLARIAQMQSTYNELVDKMESEIKRGEITISELEGRLTVNMVDRILFASGSAEIKPEGLAVLKRVADIVSNIEEKDIQVEGHTDNVNISERLQDKFASNWELSAARAATVVRFLRDAGIPGERLSAVGFGPFKPVASNKTVEGRAQNRRIQIVLVPQKRAIVKELNETK